MLEHTHICTHLYREMDGTQNSQSKLKAIKEKWTKAKPRRLIPLPSTPVYEGMQLRRASKRKYSKKLKEIMKSE